jgi:hypothetical protein
VRYQLVLAGVTGAVAATVVAAVMRDRELTRINAAIAAGTYRPDANTFGGSQT